MSVSAQPELNPLISSGAEADSRPTAHPGVERLSSRFPWCLSVCAHWLLIYFTISILLNELLQEFELESRIHL